MVRLGEVNPVVWDKIEEQLESVIDDFSSEDLSFDWKAAADSNRLHREIFSKYGYFKDIILHPRFQYYKQLIEENISWEPLLDDGEPKASTSVIVIILTILYNRIPNEALAFVAAFLLNINPVYVVPAMLMYWLFFFRRKPRKFRRIPTKRNITKSLNNQGVNVDNSPGISIPRPLKSEVYDHILIGDDISTLYTAALLSRIGHKCLIIQTSDYSHQHCVIKDCTIPLMRLAIGKPERYQHYFDLVQSEKSSNRVVFRPIGKQIEGFTHTVMRVLPDQDDSLENTISIQSQLVTFMPIQGSVAAGIASISPRHFDTQAFSTFTENILSSHNNLHSYLIAQTQSDGSVAEKLPGASQFKAHACLSIDGVMTSGGIEDRTARAVLTGLSWIGSEEALPATEASSVGLASCLTTSEFGRFYPSGGLETIRRSLLESVSVAGGQLVRNMSVSRILVHDKIAEGVSLNSNDGVSVDITSGMSVISGAGILATFTSLLPAENLSKSVHEELAKLKEARPKVYVVYAIDSSLTGEDLGLHCAEYVEIGDDSWESSRRKTLVCGSICRISCPSMEDPLWNDSHPQIPHAVVVQFEASDLLVKLMEFKFPGDENMNEVGGPMMYRSCGGNDRTVITLTRKQEDEIIATSDTKLKAVYPKLFAIEPSCMSRTVIAPLTDGHSVSSSPAKFSSKLRAATEIQALYLCGRDVACAGLMGDVQGGWVAANAVLGYTVDEMMNGRNITSDLDELAISNLSKYHRTN